MSTVDSALSLMVASKSGSITAFPMRENVHWTHLLGLRFRPFCPDQFRQYSDDYMVRSAKWGTSTCGEQRGMVSINVTKVSLIPRGELNYVVKTKKG